jgi:hypothetical protein
MKKAIIIGVLLFCLLIILEFGIASGQQTSQVNVNMRKDIKTNLKFTSPQINISNVILEEGRELHFSADFKAEVFQVHNVKIIAGIDDNVIYQHTYSQINANQSAIASFNWNASAGRHTVFFKLDPENKIAESCETDNSLSRLFDVNPAYGSPVVQVPAARKRPIVECPQSGAMDIEAVSLSFARVSYTNQSNVGYIVKWKNNGVQCISSIHWHLIDVVTNGEIYVYKAYVPNSKGYALPGEIITQEGFVYRKDLHIGVCSIDHGFLPDEYFGCSTLKLVLDYDNQIIETNESNNETEGTIRW